MKKRTDLYEILGVSPDCDEGVIHAAYRGLMRFHNPGASTDADTAKKVQEINSAYATLGNNRKRSLYDAARPAQNLKAQDTDTGPGVPSSFPQGSPAVSALPETNAEPSHRGSGIDDVGASNDGSSTGFKWIIGAVACAILYVASGSGERASDSDKLAENEVNYAADQPSEAKPAAKPLIKSKPAKIDLSDAIAFSDPANCVASPELGRAYDDMLPTNDVDGPRKSKSVTVGSQVLRPQITDARSADDPVGMVATDASLRLPPGATWNGLSLSRLVASYRAPPETDSSYTRAMRFRATPEEVRTVLSNLAFNPPAPGGYSELKDEACGGSMEVLAVPGGTELRCSWGC